MQTAGLQNRAFRVQVPVLLPKVPWRNSARPECLSYKEEAGGSNPSASTKCGRSVKGSAREVVTLAVWVRIPSVTPIEAENRLPL